MTGENGGYTIYQYRAKKERAKKKLNVTDKALQAYLKIIHEKYTTFATILMSFLKSPRCLGNHTYGQHFVVTLRTFESTPSRSGSISVYRFCICGQLLELAGHQD